MHEESQRGVKTLASMPASQLKVIESSELIFEQLVADFNLISR